MLRLQPKQLKDKSMKHASDSNLKLINFRWKEKGWRENAITKKGSLRGDRDGSMQKCETPIPLNRLDFGTNKKMTESYPPTEKA